MLEVRSAGTTELQKLREIVNDELRKREIARDAPGEACPSDWKKSANQCDQPSTAAQSLPPRHPFALPWQQPTEEITLANVDDVMRYQGWDPDQQAIGDVVRETLTAGLKAILRSVPRCPNRTKALNHVIDARMDANAAISFRGRF